MWTLCVLLDKLCEPLLLVDYYAIAYFFSHKQIIIVYTSEFCAGKLIEVEWLIHTYLLCLCVLYKLG